MKKLPIGLIAACLALGAQPSPADEDDKGMVTYAVTVTNITRGQVITPPVVVAHDHQFSLFELGQPASSELAMLAEDGHTGPLNDVLMADAHVQGVAVGTGPIMPGHSQTVMIQAPRKTHFSAAGMLAISNDAFFAIRNVHAPKKRPVTVEALGYDAGSEANSESCEFVPGPPCGSANMRDTSGAEGYVHVHAGIHGTGDLTPSTHDWRNPVAAVTIKRMK